ncbi:receptor L domain-containing protein [Chitinophaga arvensicola]|uniref:Receptor L domain-containing protein n=1 Tax=Chitinophaga arvensicola TaxID=29529 RepID=A0A1I0SA94_9BACT|nr:hypothetical protein [Chitinophaga arvensicola]SEW53161.1 Receptor L domain-containing protein [Chitinophaga arvensicola]
MKNNTILLSLMLSATMACSQNKPAISAQPSKEDKVYTGDVKLYTQKDITDFGNKQYTFINGDLNIESKSATDYSAEVLDTKPLAGIRVINGGLLITRLMNLTSLDGLQNLERVYGDFTISGCWLTKVAGFDKLSLIKGDLTISNNTAKYGENGLADITGFHQLKVVNNIHIHGNTALKKLDAFNAVEQTNTIQIMNTNLEEISNFKQLKTIKGNFSVEYSPALTKITLDKLELVDGFFALNENNTINGNIYLPRLKKIKMLYFMSNKNFNNYCGFADALRQQKIESISAEGNKSNPDREAILRTCK